jgi:tetratricopeptide (TPR) repeat protein
MQIALDSSAKKFALSGAFLLFAGWFVISSCERFLGAHYSQSGDLDRIQAVLHLQSSSAELHEQMGRVLLETGKDIPGAAQQFLLATNLNPYNARTWLELARARQVMNDLAGEREALQRAVQAEPTRPDVAWDAANFFLAAGEPERAFQLFRVILQNEPGEAYRTFQLCSRVADADTMLEKLLPADPNAYLSLIEFLSSEKQTAAAAKVWRGLLGLGTPLDSRRALAYVDFLISQRQVEAAHDAWVQTSRLSGLAAYLSSGENLITNPHFESEILNRGFDWRYRKQENVEAILDATEFHSGPRSLAINFDGPGIHDAGIGQYIPVDSNVEYDFSAYYKAGPVTGVGEVRLAIQDAFTGENYFLSDELRSAEVWRQVGGEFKTKNGAQLVALTILRVPAGSPIRAKLWVDDFSLREKEPK